MGNDSFLEIYGSTFKRHIESYIPLTCTEEICVPLAAFKTNQHYFHLPNVATELSTPEGVP